MKKLILLLVVFFSVSILLNAQNNNEYFYYYQGEKFYLELDSLSFVIISEGILPTLDIKSKLGTTAFDIGYSIESYTKQNVVRIDNATKANNVAKIYVSEVNLSKEITRIKYYETVKSLQKGNNTLQISPIFSIGEEKLSISNNFYVKLYDSNELDILLAIAEKYSVEILGFNEYMPLWYTLSCNDPTSINSIEAANLFFESQLFACVEPDSCITI